MIRVIAATAALTFLAGCDGESAANETAPANAAAEQQQPAAGPPDTIEMVAIERETALRLMEERHENYERIGDAMKQITRQLRTDSPDLVAVREGANTIATLAPQIPSWFPAGSGPDVGKTEAKVEIWQRPEDFAAKAQAMEEAALAFRAAAQGSDLAAIRAAHADLGKSCKACHDLYREEH